MQFVRIIHPHQGAIKKNLKSGFTLFLMTLYLLNSTGLVSAAATVNVFAPYYNANRKSCAASGASVVGNASSDLPTAIPEGWRSLIASAAPKYPDVDPRLVATVLWVENRRWPEFKTSGWAESEAGARGPFQFIAQTWFGWGSGVSDWSRFRDNSAYGSTAMGTDGDGDGIRDPNNPKDAVEAAFKHHAGSMGKPIATTGFTGDVEKDYNTIVFDRSPTNLLYYVAKYNGGGANSGIILSQFPKKQNTNYVVMGYWLLASNFEQGILMPDGTRVDPRAGAGAGAGDASGAAATVTDGSATGCSSAGGGVGLVSAAGYAYPIGPQKKSELEKSPECKTSTCHHGGGPARDLFVKGMGDNTAGVPVYAISDGMIKNLKIYEGIEGCYSFQLVSSKDSFQYWNGHVANVSVAEGQTVTVGQQIAEVGPRKCTANGSDPHLHIDRGCIERGVHLPGGSKGCRDIGINGVIDVLWEGLPE